MIKLFRRWRYGISYGCGYCHHSSDLHGSKFANDCKKCGCLEYHTVRQDWWILLFCLRG